jgi:hypothetical protein
MAERMPDAVDLGKTQITDKIHISSAALPRSDFGGWWLIETWIFSDDPRQRNVQVVHGECFLHVGCPPNQDICNKARKAHGHIAANLRAKFQE